MLDTVIGRDRELRAIDSVLEGGDEAATHLVLEGDAGIGKTTLLRVGVERARQRGMRVLSCAGAVAETRLSYVAIADLFSDVDPRSIAALPARQRDALDAALLRAESPDAGADPAAVATAVLSTLETLADRKPVLVAIDDAQWLDRPSARVMEFCARRLSGGVRLIVTRRPAPDGMGTPQLVHGEGVIVHSVGPLDDAAVANLLRTQAQRPLGQLPLSRIVDAAGGNPFYALEMVRALPRDEPPTGPLALPPSLRDVVASRLDHLDRELDELLLAVAALADPAEDVIACVLGTRAPELIGEAERHGVLERAGRRVRFTHPLLAEGALSRAPATRRRAMHRRLSEVVEDVEDRARHLALAGLAEAVPALDEAARRTRARGAPVAAAELLEHALELGGDATLKLRAAEHHLDAGQVPRAEELLQAARFELPKGEERARALVLLAELRTRADSFGEARSLLEEALAEASAGSVLRAAGCLQLSFVLYSLGLRAEAAEVAHEALELAERLPVPGLHAQALGVVATVEFSLGNGLDERRLRRALELEDSRLRQSTIFRPTLTAGNLLMFAGRLDEASVLLESLRREYMERGEEHDLAWLLARLVWLECWRGNLDAAARIAAEAEQRLLAVDTPIGRLLALTARAQVEAYCGRAHSARRVAAEALALAEETGWRGAIPWQQMTLGFLDLSVGEPDAAAERLEPFVAQAIASELPEPAEDGALVHGDAAEALILVGRLDVAEVLVELLERRGAALGRTWAIAVGARCRALLLAAQGDVEGAARTLERALEAHERLPMPIEHARTLLALGRVQRRQNRRRAAKLSLERALTILEAAGSPLWAEQARGELDSLGLRPGSRDALTPSEERVARLAASGLTNRQIASTLQISPKTVDSHLGRAYRKLDIRSRAELGARMG